MRNETNWGSLPFDFVLVMKIRIGNEKWVGSELIIKENVLKGRELFIKRWILILEMLRLKSYCYTFEKGKVMVRISFLKVCSCKCFDTIGFLVSCLRIGRWA